MLWSHLPRHNSHPFAILCHFGASRARPVSKSPTMVLPVPLLRLQCGVNSYEWGKKGSDSAAARFAAATPSSDLDIQADKPYAEVGIP